MRVLLTLSSGPVAEKPAEELYALDTIGSDAIRKAHKTNKPLKADEILAKRSLVPAVDSRKRSRTTDGILEPSQKRQKRNWVSGKDLQKLKKTAAGIHSLSSERLEDTQNPVHDLWANPALDEETNSEYIQKPQQKVAPGTLQKAPIALTANGKAVRAIKQPKAGSSYNPSFNDWGDLLKVEGDKEIEAETKRRRAAEADAEKEARVAASAAAVEAEYGALTDGESAWEGFESGYDSEKMMRKRPERKTQAQRNKVKRRKDLERQAKHDRKMRDENKMAGEIESAAKNNRAGAGELTVAMAEQDLEAASESGDETSLRRRRLGTTMIPEKSLELVLPEELQDSLRRLKPEGNLLGDRFRNLLVNGKVETRKPIVQPRKKRVDYTEKWTYKDFSVPV